MKERIIEGFRLAPHQRYLWGVQQSDPAFTTRCEIALEGTIRLDALNMALREVADRHEMLRTTFECLPGMNIPIQVINENTKVAFHEMDLSVFEPAAQAIQLEAVLQKYEAIPFDFKRGPIAHFCVITLAVDKRILIIHLPAICSDAWTLSNLVNEIRQAYCYFLEGQGALNEPLQYVQFSEWQNDLLEGEDGEDGQTYWRKLADLSRIGLALPFERNPSGRNGLRPELFTSRFIDLEFEPHLSKTISALVTNQEFSGQAFFLMCWQALLWRLTRQTDLVIHMVFDGRSFKELHGAVGLFARSLPINVSLSEDLQTGRLLRVVNKAISDTYAFQDHYPWESTGSGNGSKAAKSEWPVMFEYERRPGAWTHGDLNWSIIRQVVRSDRFKLKMSIIESGEVVSFQLHYDNDLYALADIQVLAEQYREVVKSAAMRLEATVADLNLIGEKLRRQIICEWNQTQISRSSDRLIHELVEEQGERNGDIIALVYQGRQLTFNALNRRADQLANHLRGLGGGPEMLVGVMLDRSVEMVVAVLGVLKAGGAYLPLDPGQPIQRLTRMLDEAQPVVILTASSLRSRLDGQSAEVLCLDSQWEAVEAHGGDGRSETIDPRSLAYVIYTSGSSGRPKGVMISHRSLMNLAAALDESVYEGAEAGMRVSLNAPLGFDASVKQIVQLAYGRTLVVVPEEVRADGEEMVRYVEEQGIEALDCTPSQLKLMMEGGIRGRGGLGLVKALVGGEAIDEGLWRELEGSEGRSYYNVYGPTECTVDASVKEVRGERATIGRPIGNVKMYILDEKWRPVGIGETGEIYIGGEGLGRGYLKSAEMTAERYIPNEFGVEGGERVYRTGDLGRYRTDGEIECLGRADQQVKVRGHRIELGEIEEVLREHPGIEDAVTVVRETRGAGKRIEAFVVSRKNASEKKGEKRTYRLPNGLEVIHQNKNETDYLYEEIFEKNSYLRNGVELEEGGCVFDVGANIGMFAMYVSEVTKAEKIYAFEPIKEIYESLKHNLSRYGEAVKVYQIGLSNREGVEKFTYYPRYTMMSGKSEYADGKAEEEVIKRYLKNEEEAGRNGREVSEREMEELLEGRFEARERECAIRTLTSVMREEGVKKIDLLKVDVQRAEKEVLEGIEEEEWGKIKQVVMEVHDQKGEISEGRTKQLKGLLEAKGYEVQIEQDDLLKGTDRYNLYAVRVEVKKEREKAGPSVSKEYRRNVAGNSAPLRSVSVESLMDYLRERVPEYMMPAAIAIIEEMPLTRNGKVDREGLPAVIEERAREKKERARTEIEELMAGIWKEVLVREEIGLEEDFFELGGHSLLATQLMSRVRKIFKVEMALRRLFEEPTVRRLSGVVEKELRRGAVRELPPIERAKPEATRPLSYAQGRLWFLEQLDPGNSVYNCPSVTRVHGKLNESLLEGVFQEIVRRHEVLRSRIVMVNGDGTSVICDTAEVRIELVDLRGMEWRRLERTIKRLALEEARRPFDLAEAPLLRVKLLKLEEEDHIILLTMHHIVSDAWSMGLFDREIRQLYAAYRDGRPSPLDELSVHYGDYAAWQREWLSGDVIEEQLGYWKKHLEGARTVLALPTDRPRPAVMRHPGASQHFRLPAGLSARLRALGRIEGATLFMTLMSVFQLLLHRHTGEHEIIVGTPISGRNQFEIEPLIGFFVNTLVIRTKLSGGVNFRELLRYVRDITLEAHAHQDLPFEKLIEAIGVERSLSYNPLFQVMLVLENVSNESPELPGLKFCPFDVGAETQKFDLTLSASDAGGDIGIAFLYNTDLFDASTIARMSGHFQTLLEEGVSDPSRPLGDLRLLTEAERQQMLVEWNDTAKTDDQRAVHELFEAQVERAPDAIAAVFEDQWVTYHELNGRANQLSRYLNRLGVGPEAPVGLCLERSIEMVVGILGVLKSGGAYLPLDPAYPRERLAVILEDSQGPILLTQQRLVEKLPDDRARIICLDADLEAMSSESNDDPAYHVTLDNACYVIYTSGSTGLPKGVVNTHRGVCNLLLWMQNAYGLNEDDRFLQKAPFTFDMSVCEIFWPLLSGARLVIARPDEHRDSAYLIKLISEEGITAIHFVSSVLQFLLDDPEFNNSKGLRYVICSGEALSLELQEKFFERMPCQLLNMYGVTEAAVETTHWSCERNSGRKSAPIGIPIANTSIYLLDGDFQPVPLGAHGELHIGGIGVARNYLRRPGLTSEKFVPDPIGNEPGGRLYKTGDLTRYRPDGVIEYLGRFDHQVKVRGHRIETGEIEVALSAHRGVDGAVVVAREDVRGDKQLVAYIVSKSAPPPQVDELRNHVKESLPDFMVPSVFVFLESFPLSFNGKLDRKSLPPPVSDARAAGENFLPPRDNLEFQLTELWGDILEVKNVGVKDDFFSLGGHSLMAVRLMARLREQYCQALPLSALFQYTTVERLASVLRGQVAPSPYSPVVEIRGGNSRTPFFCVHPLGGEVVCYVDLARRLPAGQPFYGLQARGMDGAAPLTSIEEMAYHYIQAMRAVQSAGPYLIGGWSFGGTVAFEMARQIREAGETVGLLAIIDAGVPRRDEAGETVELPAIIDAGVPRRDGDVSDVPELDDTEFMLYLFGQYISISREEFKLLTPDEKSDYLLKELKAKGMFPPDFGPVEARFYYDLAKANFLALLKYAPRPYDGKVTLFRSIERSGFTDPTLGWGQLAERGVDIHVVPGKHHEIVLRPHVHSLAEALVTSLNAVERGAD